MSGDHVPPCSEFRAGRSCNVNVSRAFTANKVSNQLIDCQLIDFATHAVECFVRVARAIVSAPAHAKSRDTVAACSADNVVILEARLVDVGAVSHFRRSLAAATVSKWEEAIILLSAD